MPHSYARSSAIKALLHGRFYEDILLSNISTQGWLSTSSKITRVYNAYIRMTIAMHKFARVTAPLMSPDKPLRMR